jgi:hypothetical protein
MDPNPQTLTFLEIVLQTVAATVVMLLLAALSAWLLHQMSRSQEEFRRRRRTVRVRPPLPETPPRRFSERMAEYLGQPETPFVAQPAPYKSTMPFWMAIDVLKRVPPKSIELIRRALMRIQKLASH